VSDQAHDRDEQIRGAPFDGVDSPDQRIELTPADATGRPASARLRAQLFSCHGTLPERRSKADDDSIVDAVAVG
jgi:hypothetical protein